MAQGVQQALDVGDGRFEVVRGGIDEGVEVGVGAREALVGIVQLGVGGLHFLVQSLHLLAGAHLVGYLHAHSHEASGPLLVVEEGLHHEVDVALPPLGGAGLGQQYRGLGYRIRLAGAQHFGKNLFEALARRFRYGLEVGPAQNLRRRPPPDGRHGRVGQLHHVVGAAQDGDGHRGLRENALELLLLGFALLAGQHLLGHLKSKHGDAAYLPILAVGLVHEREIGEAGRLAGQSRHGEEMLHAKVCFAGLVHLVQQVDEALLPKLGQGVGQVEARQLPVGKKALVGGVDVLDAVVRGSQQQNQGGGLVKNLVEGFSLLKLLAGAG